MLSPRKTIRLASGTAFVLAAALGACCSRTKQAVSVKISRGFISKLFAGPGHLSSFTTPSAPVPGAAATKFRSPRDHTLSHAVPACCARGQAHSARFCILAPQLLSSPFVPFATAITELLQRPEPVLALAPMQDVTDLPFWELMSRYGGPDIYYTEYFRVHATSNLEKPILKAITANPTGRPAFAQMIGNDIP